MTESNCVGRIDNQMNDEKYVLVCESCAKDIGITPEELSTAIMLPKPLTDDEMTDFITTLPVVSKPDDLIGFFRALEKMHGIL